MATTITKAASETNTADRTKRLLRWKSDPAAYIQECLHIQTKDMRVAPMSFRHFPAQKKFIDIVKQQREAGVPVRIVCLKARQVGQTSISTALLYHHTVHHKNVRSQIVSNDLESAGQIHSKNEIFYEMSPIRPLRARSTGREMYFANPRKAERSKRPGLRSRISIESAAKATIGRSQSVHNFLGSEAAYWIEGEKRGVSAMQAVPDLPNTTVILESTGNGVGGFFYERYQEAKKATSIWVPFFYPWFEQPEYVYTPDDKYNCEDLSDEEQGLVNEYGLRPEQIAWRRYAIAEKLGNDPEMFRQEYPSNDEEAFLVSGRPAFDRARIKYQIEHNVRHGQPMELHMIGTGYRGSSAPIRPEPVRGGPLVVWEPPETGHLYIIGADCAQGVEGGDYNAACVIDAITRRQVAEFHALCDHDDYSKALVAMASWYNGAMLAIEKNGSGLNVLAKCAWMYGNLFHTESWDEETQTRTKKAGWLTTDQTKRLIMHEMQTALRTAELTIRSGPLLEEMMYYQRDLLGRFEASEGKHDDRVMASAIAWFIARSEQVRLQLIESAVVDEVNVRMPLELRIAGYEADEAQDLDFWML